MKSKALEINLECYRVDVTIEDKYAILQEVMSKYYGKCKGMSPNPRLATIVYYLDKKCSELTELQENIKQQISILEQYRKSLIHECVTGKRRITDGDVQN